MLSFKKLTLSDKQLVDNITLPNNNRCADFDFGNMLLWDNLYNLYASVSDERLVLRMDKYSPPVFTYPVGNGDLSHIINELHKYCLEQNYPFVMASITDDDKEHLDYLFPRKFKYELDADNSDYIYLIDKLSNFSGKALHSKKNHCNHFEKEYDGYKVEPLNAENIPLCIKMLDQWELDNKSRLNLTGTYEYFAIKYAFNNFNTLSLEGIALIYNDDVLGFSLGEICSKDTFDVHFEKADININGAYTVVCREMARLVHKNHPELIYINREEDMGLEHLRHSKLSYKPEFILNKYIARWVD